MSVDDLERAVAGLPPEEFVRFAAWFAEYQADAWDRQIERDLQEGRLDDVLRQAREDVAAGRSKPL